MRQSLYRLAALVALPGALLGLAGCEASRTFAPARGAIPVVERDFHISVPKQVSSGDVRLSVFNKGPDDHELIVVKAGASRLPFRADGLTVDEDALGSREVGALEPGDPREVRELRVRLAPGRYELFCNMAGHYLGGMHTEFEVR